MLINYSLTEDMMPLIKKEAQARQLPESIVLAIVEVESNFNPFAVRYEPHYRYAKVIQGLKPHDCSIETEIMLQKTSFGLFQIMGGTARYMGFNGWLTKLLIPTINVRYGVLWLSKLYKKYAVEYGLDGVIAAYNAGSPRKKEDGSFVNQKYVDEVLEKARKY